MRLKVEPDMRVVGETGKTGEALYLAQALAPDVVLVDLSVSSDDGFPFLERLRAEAPAGCAIVVLALHGDNETSGRARRAGAQAFLEMCGGTADLIETIRHLAARRHAEDPAAGAGALLSCRPGDGPELHCHG
jgi:DNA-binding NarL/FixJ family response regulator